MRIGVLCAGLRIMITHVQGQMSPWPARKVTENIAYIEQFWGNQQFTYGVIGKGVLVESLAENLWGNYGLLRQESVSVARLRTKLARRIFLRHEFLTKNVPTFSPNF